ncbi:MAG: hypothetical protein MJ188_12505, partial [Treponema sp.]|nr:hypothetical protein [Treponema sp.]
YIYFATIFKPYVTAEVVKIEKANCNFEKYTVNLEKYDNPSDRIEDFTFFANDNYLGFTLYFYRSSYGWVTTRNYYNIFEIKPNDEEELELVLNEQLTQELNGFLTDKISEEYKGDPEYQKFEIIDSMIDKDNNIYSLFAGAEATVLYCGSFVKFTFDGTDYTSYTNYYHSTNAIDFHSDDSMRTIYGPESKYSNLLFGPQKFLLVSEEPKKLVIADDGTFFFTRGGDIYFSNINRVVFVNLEENVSVEAVTLVEDEFENYIGYDSYDISCRSYLNAKKLISRSND